MQYAAFSNQLPRPIVDNMNLTEALHERFLTGRRARVLAGHIAALLPAHADVLDVGTGDGDIARRIVELRPDVTVRGIDVLVRPETAIPVEPFDGTTIPHPDDSFDAVTIVDVLHHTDDPAALLFEARRVARSAVVVKDHLRHGAAAAATLRFMDRVGNERHGVSLPFNYLDRSEWDTVFDASSLTVATWVSRLGIYVWPASWLFDRRLHFVASLKV